MKRDETRESRREPHGEDLGDEDELRVQRIEEELRAGTRERQAGKVDVSKRVRTDREQVRVPTRHEEVSVDRVPVNEEGTGAEIGEEEEISVPVVEDEVVAEKRPVVKEEVRIRKGVLQDEELVEEEVRKEEVEVEDRTEQYQQRLGDRAEHQRTPEGEPESSTAGDTEATEERRAEAERPGREETGNEDFIEKAKRKLQGR